MYCPYCGKENDDSAQYCAGCGQFIKEAPGFSEPDQPAGPDASGGSANGGGNRNRIYITVIIIIVAAAVVAILFITGVFPWPFHGNTAVESEEIGETGNAATEETSAGIGEVASVQEKEEEEEISEASEDDVWEETAEDTETYPDDVIEQPTVDAVKTTAEYSIQTQHTSAKDSNGNTVADVEYDLVVLAGDDDVTQKINARMEQDYQDYLDECVNSINAETIDEGTTEGDSGTDMHEYYSTSAEVTYDKNGVLSILYSPEYYNTMSVHPFGSEYGQTYSLETGEQLQITDLTDLSDAELLEEIKSALLETDYSVGYFDDTKEKINSLTLNDIGNEDSGLELDFIVEGGEIVIVVPHYALGPYSMGSFKVPTTVYIKTMSYDEYTADYIFPDSDARYLTRSDLEGLSKEELRLGRNEIFARRGRLFRDENLDRYFKKRSWYHGTTYEEDFDQSVFNDYEWKNLNLLNDYDKEMGYQA